MDDVRAILGYTVQTPRQFELLLNNVFTAITKDHDEKVLNMFTKDAFRILQYFSQLRLLVREELRTPMTRLIYAICSEVGSDAVDALVAPPCAIAHWLLVPFINEEEWSDDADLSTSLAMVTLLFREAVDIPDIFMRVLNKGGIQGIGKAALLCIELDYGNALDHAIYAMSAVNLHLSPNFAENELLKFLESNRDMTELGISLVSILNRAEPAYLISMLKLFNDIFLDMKTANYFYSNDLKVIIDVLLLESTNLEVGDLLRVQYLEILYHLLMNCTDYLTSFHKQSEILQLVTALAGDENIPSSARDLCHKILSNCSTLLTLNPNDVCN